MKTNYTGKVLISVASEEPPTPEKILEMEMWLNSWVAGEAFTRFGLGLRFHLSEKSKQEYDPFAVDGETHCGDCNRLLTNAEGRWCGAVFDESGVHCDYCYKYI